jgi:hypothetical protein
MQKAMTDSQGINKGYFVLHDLYFHLKMLPNTPWDTYDQEEDLICQLMRQHKVTYADGGGVTGEPLKYQLATTTGQKLSSGGGT